MQSAKHSQRREQLTGARVGFIEEMTFELTIEEQKEISRKLGRGRIWQLLGIAYEKEHMFREWGIILCGWSG